MRSAIRKGGAHRTLRYLLGVVAVCALAFGVPSSARPAEGDLLRTLNPPGAQGGVSVAFDGTRVYWTNFNGTVLFSVLPDGSAQTGVPIVGAAGGVNAFSYDGSRDMFWAAGGATGRDIYLLDQTGIATLQFTITNTPGNCDNGFGCLTLIDGMAYDGFADTVWWSPDASQRVYEYTTTAGPSGPPGTLVRFYDVNDPPNDTAAQCGFNYSSGVAVSSSTETYNVANGCDFIFRYTKTGTKVSFFMYPGQRGEDAECDDVTFPVTAIWVRDVTGPIQAFEIVGECPVGGGVVPCPPEEDEDDDGVDDEDERKILGLLLNDSDSDDDGINDGNDDGNGNGEDDEDEDDDDDDDCPEEDDDGDGTDDEDEDDDEDDD